MCGYIVRDPSRWKTRRQLPCSGSPLATFLAIFLGNAPMYASWPRWLVALYQPFPPTPPFFFYCSSTGVFTEPHTPKRLLASSGKARQGQGMAFFSFFFITVRLGSKGRKGRGTKRREEKGETEGAHECHVVVVLHCSFFPRAFVDQARVIMNYNQNCFFKKYQGIKDAMLTCTKKARTYVIYWWPFFFIKKIRIRSICIVVARLG